MRDKHEKKRMRTLRWVATPTLLAVVAIAVALFFSTSLIVRVALRRVFRDNAPGIGAAEMSFSGTLVMHDLVLHDRGAYHFFPAL